MKVSREKAAQHRAAIVEAAGALFRARGFAGVGVAEITAAAGLTHGGFYGHFASKDALAAEACGQVTANSAAKLSTAADLRTYLDNYLSERHRNHPEAGCPFAALAGDAARGEAPVRARFAEGLDRFVDALAARLPDEAGDDAGRRARALMLASAMVGALTLARSVASSDPDLSRELLAAVRAQLDAVLGAPGDGL